MVNATLTIRDSKPRFILSGGSYCKARADDIPGDMKGSALVEFACDKSVFGPGQPRLVAQLPPGDDEEACAWVIEWRTPVCSQLQSTILTDELFAYLVRMSSVSRQKCLGLFRDLCCDVRQLSPYNSYSVN
jgi:hypothetical protein